MLDGLLGRGGFSSKCKSLIKPTRTRIEVLRRRAEAKQRFLKEDLVKLLSNGLDVNAYGRTEDFISGLNLLSCYSFIDQSCEYILKQLPVMQKLGQCPEECRETVASLMFAAARFSDLPELRDLRDVFQERYGTGLECYVNQVFVEKIASNPPVMEKKIKLLQDIAAEFSIQWDSKGFRKRMDKPSMIAEDQARKVGPLSVADDMYRLPNENTIKKNDQLSKERTDHAHEGPKLQNGRDVNVRRKEVFDVRFIGREEKNGYKHEDGRYFSKPKHESASESNGIGKNDTDTPVMMKTPGRSHRERIPEVFNDARVNIRGKERHGYKQEPITIRAETIEPGDNNDHFNKERQEFTVRKHGSSGGPDHTPLMKSPRTFRDRKPDILGSNGTDEAFLKEERPNHHYHRKSERNIDNGDEEGATKSTGKVQEEEIIRLKPCYNGSLPPPYVKSNIPPPYSKPDRTHKKHDGPFHERRAHRPSNDLNALDSDTNRKEQRDHDGLWEDRRYHNDIPLPKPRSVRRKHSKSSSSHDDVASSEDARIVRRISSSRRKERKGLQILFDDEHYHGDKEEKMMDKLLLHYSKKPSAYDVGKLRRQKSLRSNTSKSPHHREAEIIVPPTRSISLPHEQSGESEPKKVYARANSFQADNQAPHVHPKLPDYDDLAARFAALRGR